MSIMQLFMDLIHGGNVAPDGPQTGEGERLPSAVHRERLQSNSYTAQASKFGRRAVSPRVSAGAGRHRLGHQGGGYVAEHTQSNLG